MGLMKKILEVIESNETGLSKVGKHPSDSNHQILQKQLKEFQTSSKTTSMRTAKEFVQQIFFQENFA